MWKTFNDFILCMCGLNKELAEWFAKEAINKENNLPCKIRENKPKIISNWREDFNLNNLMTWATAPQGEHIWRNLHLEMMRHPEIRAAAPKRVPLDIEAAPDVRVYGDAHALGGWGIPPIDPVVPNPAQAYAQAYARVRADAEARAHDQERAAVHIRED